MASLSGHPFGASREWTQGLQSRAGVGGAGSAGGPPTNSALLGPKECGHEESAERKAGGHEEQGAPAEHAGKALEAED